MPRTPKPKPIHPVAQQIMDAQLDGRDDVTIVPGVYADLKSVRLVDIHGMTIHTDGVQLPYDPRPSGTKIPQSRETWSLKGCTDLTIVGAQRVTGFMPFHSRGQHNREGQHAFGLHGCARINIEGAVVRDVWGDGLYLGGTGPKATRVVNHDITVDMDVDNVGRHTITCLAVDQLDVRGTWSNWPTFRHLDRGVDYEHGYPGDYHKGVRLAAATWLPRTDAPR